MPEPRRSGRQRKVNPRYANDGWDKDTLRTLRADSTSSGSSPVEEGSTSSDSNDDSHVVNHVSAQEEDDDDASVASAASIQSSDVETPDPEDNDGGMSLASDEDAPTPKRRSRPSRLPYATPAGGEATRSRGIQPPSRLGKRSAYANIFGPEIDDLRDVLVARDTWLKGQDVTIPSRQTLAFAIQQSRDLDQCDTGSNKDSAPEGEDDAFMMGSLFDTVRNHQVLEPIGRKTVYEKYLLHDMPAHTVVLGARGKQTKFGLDYLSPLDMGKAWLDHEKPGGGQTLQDGEPATQKRYHQAWLLNVGEKVQCFAWAVSARSVQYLAIAVKCTSSQRRMAISGRECERPAFHPSPAYSSSIQIWAFHTTPTSVESVRTLAMDEEPSLAVVIGTEWGNIRQLRWCQLDPDTETLHKNTVNPTIGLLAAISSDGHARVIAVRRPESRKARTTPITIRVERAGFDIPPPRDTVFTTLAFAGPTNLMLGTADGFLHSFDLTEPMMSQGANNIPKCYMKQQLHHTHVISVCAASPGSPQSTFLASTSASGDLALTDLRSPEHDCIHVPRPSFPTRDLIYAPFTHSFITLLDSSGNTQMERNAATFLVCHHIRQFPNLLKVARLPHDTGAATALTGSQWHPCILVGNAKGQVLATNYLRKVLPYRKSDPKKAVWAYLQKICEYDWRPLTPQERRSQSQRQSQRHGRDREDGPPPPPSPSRAAIEPTTQEDIDIYHGHDTRAGMSRFHEGFKPEKIEVAPFQPSAKRSKKTAASGELGQAVFEEEQAVTALEWNPNSTCAGIVAIGWASGVVRVQDLAYDFPSSA
ncbi:uncharacterized protein Z520_04776 [Fonsecaea multimorphosa CBS 102226]|uniref:Uncharacterized protein n=1 Tax=Fonsecaea multimorphosa CBS 102226 TaxID=1442371 RepID=A0A0D2HBC1_9EURO|nr:uncharacterized protein Z520_04776 [Fonsecaea multimorphosa CBS 102226]KIX99200.1 hypothetical protein Z520_04776 [Fonsecaea multimorphosa CBS 102226]OAL25897.1 hypothetical protein AYO22_04524 [Fonsecaea multimorphosa]